jgi:hypothetical protein
MDRVAKEYEKFGTVSISSPLLVEAKREPKGDGYFDFNLPASANDYYVDARTNVQGQSAIFDQFVKTSGFGLSAQVDVTALMGYIANLQEYAQKLSEYHAQKSYLSQARELEAQTALGNLQDASADEVKNAMAKAAKIRAGDPNNPLPYPSFPSPPPCNLPPLVNVAPEANRTLGALSDSNSMKYLGLLGSDKTLSISNRSAITTAAGDTATEGIFRLLGNPAEAMKFKDKLIMFGVSMVSVNPGWLTNKNYTAELSVSCYYSHKPARRELLIRLRDEERKKYKEEPNLADKNLIDLIGYVLGETPIDESKIKVNVDNKGEKSYTIKDDFVPQRFRKKSQKGSPLLAAVSPMMDVDTLDLASSQRIQISNALRFAAALSYAGGAKAQAEYFEEWAKRREQDVHTRTAYAAVTAFSNGGFFGFRIRPRLRALENPALFSSKPENVLDPQAFPVLVIIGIDRDDLQLSFDIERDSNDQPTKYANGELRLVALEPTISFRQTATWLPSKSTESIWDPGKRLSETERLSWAYNITKAYKDLNSAGDDIDNNDVKRFIKNRILLLEYHTLDSWNEQCIPMDLMIEPNDLVIEPNDLDKKASAIK